MATRNYRKLTPDDEARHERIMAMARERIAYHEAKTREAEQRRAQRGLLSRIKRSVRAARAAW